MSGETVKLNVGGKTFEVAKSTLTKHPDALLAKLVDAKWHAQQTEAIFVDADGSLFEYVLQYYRRGAPVIIPYTVTKGQLKKEFDYYGITLTDEQLEVERVSMAVASKNRLQHLQSLKEEADDLMEQYMVKMVTHKILTDIANKTDKQVFVRPLSELADLWKGMDRTFKGLSNRISNSLQQKGCHDLCKRVRELLEGFGYECQCPWEDAVKICL
ncbi:unnamed protein product [Vitrella brassicaformis CCMP3155]|uniref:BTB domain-containing protein n=1 Tax=Vitrella brassicaformis (strain CCMP3155) TaxID=1169540 RepID=A0A0G4EIA5_VITBC|nr:unnamed protein product [Vitrella brassicaformis CCMP3155]|eukprot:CEL95738.1 unnamed protein product [Vitrella brassicaformis CCMP3155]